MNEDKLNESCRAFRHERKRAWLSALEKQRLSNEETTGHVIKRHFVCISYSLFSSHVRNLSYILVQHKIQKVTERRRRRKKKLGEVVAILFNSKSDVSLSLLLFNTVPGLINFKNNPLSMRARGKYLAKK